MFTGTDLDNLDFSRLAEAIGIAGIRLEDLAEVPAAVEQMLVTPGPVLLDAVVEPGALALPPHIGFGVAEGFALSLAKQPINAARGSVQRDQAIALSGAADQSLLKIRLIVPINACQFLMR